MDDILISAADPEFARFQRRVISDTRYPILGVRMPILRRLAKQAAREEMPLEYFEQVRLKGLSIAYTKTSMEEKLAKLRKFLPEMDSWAMTDSIVPTLQPKPEELSALWDFAVECIAEEGEYTVRFGIVIFLNHFLTETYIPQVADQLCTIRDDRYYIRMAVSWCFAEMAVTDYERVEAILRSGCLDLFVHNKTIQKMRESYRITKEQKAAVWLLRRK